MGWRDGIPPGGAVAHLPSTQLAWGRQAAIELVAEREDLLAAAQITRLVKEESVLGSRSCWSSATINRRRGPKMQRTNTIITQWQR